MVSMGFTKEEAAAAMKAAFNNPERAIDYLLNVREIHILTIKGYSTLSNIRYRSRYCT
jgi:hypothetical protein